ncbi:MAG: helix-turn-helix transcriptional regulator [Clostridiales bacterium]|nr:helix-turn-helix transcriptional regulator [Clostridiales bacterium]
MFSSRIKELRISTGLNQVDFAKKLSVTKQSVSNWENGNIQPSIDMLVKIATIFSVSADYLLGLDKRSTIDVSNLTEKQKSHIQSIVDDIRNK